MSNHYNFLYQEDRLKLTQLIIKSKDPANFPDFYRLMLIPKKCKSSNDLYFSEKIATFGTFIVFINSILTYWKDNKIDISTVAYMIQSYEDLYRKSNISIKDVVKEHLSHCCGCEYSSFCAYRKSLMSIKGINGWEFLDSLLI